MIRIIQAESQEELDQVRFLFLEYEENRGFDAPLGDFQNEMDGLPGSYASPDGRLLLALNDADPAGVVAFQKIGKKICEMKRMYVRPLFRGKGLGKTLTEELIRQAKESGYQIMRLDTHPVMTSAKKLYLSLGFCEIARYNNNPIPGIRFF